MLVSLDDDLSVEKIDFIPSGEVNEEKSDAAVADDFFQVRDLMGRNVVESQRGFRLGLFAFKIDVTSPVNAVVIGRRLLFKVGVDDARVFAVIHLDDADRRRTLGDDRSSGIVVVGIRGIDRVFKIHAPVGGGQFSPPAFHLFGCGIRFGIGLFSVGIIDHFLKGSRIV